MGSCQCPQGRVRSEPGMSLAKRWPWSFPSPPASWTSSSGCCCLQGHPSLSLAPLFLACSQCLGLPGVGGGWVLQESYRVASNGAWRSCMSARQRLVHCLKTAARPGCADISFFSVSLFLLWLHQTQAIIAWSSHAVRKLSSCLTCLWLFVNLHCSWQSLAPLLCCADAAERSGRALASHSVTLLSFVLCSCLLPLSAPCQSPSFCLYFLLQIPFSCLRGVFLLPFSGPLGACSILSCLSNEL